MPEPREFRILQSLQTALRGIATADGYFHDVAAVAVKLDPNAEVETLIAEASGRPFIVLELRPDVWAYQPANRAQLTLPVTVHFVNDSNVADDDSFLKTITRLWADVETALAADITRGGDATDTRINGRDFRSFDGGLAWAIVPLTITVNRSYGLPTG